MDHSQIIHQIKKGNQYAFRLLVEQYQAYAFKLAFRIVCNEEDAKDVVQESFIKIWRNIHNYRPSVKFTTWMYKIVTNSAIDLYRENARQSSVSLNESINIVSESQHDSTNKNQNNKELSILIRKMADGLPEKQRLIFVLRDLQEMDSHEVQEILEISETTVKSNLYHARKSIKEKIRTLLAYERRYTWTAKKFKIK